MNYFSQELSNTECKLTATQSKLAVAEHKIQGLEQTVQKQRSRNSDTRCVTFCYALLLFVFPLLVSLFLHTVREFYFLTMRYTTVTFLFDF